jgi:hypothetical protein
MTNADIPPRVKLEQGAVFQKSLGCDFVAAGRDAWAELLFQGSWARAISRTVVSPNEMFRPKNQRSNLVPPAIQLLYGSVSAL